MTKDGEAGVSAITSHTFTPRGDWYSLCRVCGLAESAHVRTALRRCASCGVRLLGGEDGRCYRCRQRLDAYREEHGEDPE